MNMQGIVQRQREFYLSGATRPLEFRMRQLKTLREAIRNNERLITDAMAQDLNKSPMETYMCESGMVLDELGYHLKHLPRWIKERRVPSPLAQFPARSFVAPEPHGVALIMSPWNYPVQLCLSPLVGAISGGNCAVVKPSAYTPATSHAIAKLLGEAFPPEFVAVVEGGREQNSQLLEQRFDYIFFTGSVAVGKVVMEAASKNLTPVTLELGGKSPVIVDESANIPLAARRVAFGKVLNAGQTCVAPDYLLIHRSVKAQFVAEFEAALKRFFPSGDMGDMPVIINQKHYERVKGLMQGQIIALGGQTEDERRFIAPTLLDTVAENSPVMQEEIFGPLLPMLEFSELGECVEFIRARPRPLALYLFTTRAQAERQVLGSCSFGGGCINDTIIHLATPHMAFGGVGDSGMGSYHGEASFNTFSHFRSVLKKANWLDLPMRYHPYTQQNFNLVRKFMK